MLLVPLLVHDKYNQIFEYPIFHFSLNLIQVLDDFLSFKYFFILVEFKFKQYVIIDLKRTYGRNKASKINSCVHKYAEDIKME